MGIFTNLFKKNTEENSSKNVEDFVSLTRVYFQSVIAANLGITNIRFVPDVANFKRLFKIPTQGGRLGQAEKAASKKMLMQDYGLSENFFKEIDSSVKKHCRTQNDVQSYLFMYQGFSNDLMMLMGNLMQWKFRMPSIFKGALRTMTEKTVHEVCTKTVWKKDDVHKTAASVRQYKERLGYSEQWMTEYVYNIVMLAKKEAGKKKEETEK
ncbi:hypothetical protein [Bacteroides ndongoniae]|uniref:hypothetical protein n=1 Tax=Bacteroides ndongoniae TaxID=1903262 RepID=UPI0023F80EA4|nr:hypothetical protein [Bacteroides ndongoniae]